MSRNHGLESLAPLRLTIEDVLIVGFPRIYTPDFYQQKCSTVFEYVHESYPECDASVYAVLERRLNPALFVSTVDAV